MIRTNARDLGLKLQWRYAFVPQGSTHRTTHGTVFLDVGGALEPGVIDQHQGGSGASSTCELVERHQEFVYGHLLTDWLRRRDDGQDLAGRVFSPALVTHHYPDFDALTSIYLVQQLIEEGCLPPETRALVEYATEVDQGRYRLADHNRTIAPIRLRAVHLAYLIMQHDHEHNHAACLDAGLRLLDQFIRAVRAERELAKEPRAGSGRDLHPEGRGAMNWCDDPQWQGIVKKIEEDQETWTKIDLPGHEAVTVALPVHSATADTLQVPALILHRASKSNLNKYWARAAGYAYLICPYDKASATPDAPATEGAFPRVILSLDPTWSDPTTGERPTLQGLGYALEQAEAAFRKANGGDQRNKTPRFDDGFCDNDDPWYDGRGHEYTIIDAPREGGRLPYDQITQIAQSPFWQTPVKKALVVVIDLPGREPLELEKLDPSADGRAAGELAQLCGACRQRWKKVSLADAPIGFNAVEERWSLSDGNSLEVRSVRLSQREGVEATLEGITEWARQRRASGAQDTRVYARFEVGKSFAPSHQVDTTVANLFRTGPPDSTPVIAGSQRIWLDGQTVVANLSPSVAGHADAVGTPDEHVLIYSLLIDKVIDSFSQRIADCIDVSRGRVRAATVVQRDFLSFQGQYQRDRIRREPVEQLLFSHVAAHLRLGERLTDLEAQVDRLSELQQAEQGKQLERFLAFMSFVGVAEVVLAVADDTASVPGWKWIGLALVFGLGGVLYVWLGRPPTDRTTPE